MNSLEELLRRLGLGLTELANELRDVFNGPRLREKTLTIAAGKTSGEVLHGLTRAHQGAFIVAATGELDKPWIPPASVSGSTLVRVNVATAPASDVTLTLRVF